MTGDDDAERDEIMDDYHRRAPETAAPGNYVPPPPGDAPRDLADAPAPEMQIAGTESPEGQWAQAWREFRKRKGALVALAVIFLLVTLAIFAPLIANDRPIVYHGANRFEYSEAARSIRAMLANAATSAEKIPAQLATVLEELGSVKNVPDELILGLKEAASTSKTAVPTELEDWRAELQAFIETSEAEGLARSQRRQLTRAYEQLDEATDGANAYAIAAASIPDQFDRMIALVIPKTGAALAKLQERSIEGLTGKLDRETANELRGELREYPTDEVLFVGQWRFPVFAPMDGRGIGFLVLNTLVILAIAAKLIFRRRWSRRTRRRVGWGLVVVPLAAAGLWELTVPDRIDRTPYKQGIPAAQAGEHDSAPVLYTFAIWPPIPYGLDETDLDAILARPAIMGPDPDAAQEQPAEPIEADPYAAPHWLGTDDIGRDTLARMLWGARVSLAVGILAVTIYVSIGIVVGAIAGFFRGGVDMVLSRIIEVVLVFPAFFLILTIVAFVGPSLWNIMLVIGLTGWTGVARLVRGEFLRLADQEFVLAGRALGYSSTRLIFRHILPNALAPVLVAATFGVAGAILVESALSFLGIGITIPTPSWGNILADGRNYKVIAPWLIYFPGLAIFITILCYNLAGEALRDALDPRLRGSR